MRKATPACSLRMNSRRSTLPVRLPLRSPPTSPDRYHGAVPLPQQTAPATCRSRNMPHPQDLGPAMTLGSIRSADECRAECSAVTRVRRTLGGAVGWAARFKRTVPIAPGRRRSVRGDRAVRRAELGHWSKSERGGFLGRRFAEGLTGPTADRSDRRLLVEQNTNTKSKGFPPLGR